LRPNEYAHELEGQQRAQPQGQDQQHRRGAQPEEQAQAASGKGALALAVVLAVGFQVQHVVEQVDRRSAQAEGHEGQQGLAERGHIGHAVRRQQGHHDQAVLGPLVHAQGLGHHLDAAGQGLHHVFHRGHFGRSRLQAGTGVDHDGAARVRPHTQVHRVVAHVIEALLTEALDQFCGLVAARQVGLAIAGQHAVEEAHMVGHGLRQAVIRGRAEPELAACGLLRFQPGQQGLGVRQGRAIELHTAGDLGLQLRLATQQPQRQQEEVERVGFDQQEEGFQQQVAVDQRAVEVDAQGGLVSHGQTEETDSLRSSQTHNQPITTANHRVSRRQIRVSKMACGVV
jgi:hypothetical protein